jgi:hypothetical protein
MARAKTVLAEIDAEQDVVEVMESQPPGQPSACAVTITPGAVSAAPAPALSLNNVGPGADEDFQEVAEEETLEMDPEIPVGLAVPLSWSSQQKPLPPPLTDFEFALHLQDTYLQEETCAQSSDDISLDFQVAQELQNTLQKDDGASKGSVASTAQNNPYVEPPSQGKSASSGSASSSTQTVTPKPAAQPEAPDAHLRLKLAHLQTLLADKQQT